MKCVTMIYPNKPGARFNFDYYLNRHIPWSIKISGDLGTEIRRGVSTPSGGPAPYICICRFWIDSEDQFRAIMQEHGKELMADVSNFTNIEPVVQIDEVLLDTRMRKAA